MVTKDHHLIRFNLPIYGANDIIDGLLLLVVVDFDEGLAADKVEKDEDGSTLFTACSSATARLHYKYIQ